MMIALHSGIWLQTLFFGFTSDMSLVLPSGKLNIYRNVKVQGCKHEDRDHAAQLRLQGRTGCLMAVLSLVR